MAHQSVLEATISSVPNQEAGPYGLPAWFMGVFQFLLVGILGLIALGGATRIMNAGLACPDWPLCFGDFIPDYHPQVYFEFIHRVIAGVVAIITVTLQWHVWNSQAPRRLKLLGGAIVGLLLTQVIFGGLTVLLQLHSKVVAAHLGMGTGFFALSLLMYLNLRGGPREDVEPSWLAIIAGTVTAFVYGQIILGGLVASHFASLVCTDFPTCHGQWFPTFQGIIGLHVIHRLGAYLVFLSLLTLWLVVRQFSRSVFLRKISGWMFALVCVQVGIGIANVVFHTPPIIAVAHLVTAATILGLGVTLTHTAWRARQA